MANLFPSLARRILPRLGQAPARSGGLRQWFSKGAYSGSIDPISQAVVLGNVNPADLIDYLAFDYERFALASYESFFVASLESDNHKLVSWSLLKLYYSSFFAAHAIMRSLGEAVVKIDREQTDVINLMVDASSGISPNLSAGMYRCTIREVRPGQLDVMITPHIDGAGVHDGFWKTFANYLNDKVIKAVASSDADANIMLAGVDEINNKLRGWLAARRNDINYQQAFGVWYPVQKSKVLNELIGRIRKVDSDSIDLKNQIDSVIPCFVNITQYLACLNAELANHIAVRSGRSGSFGNKWTRFQALKGAR